MESFRAKSQPGGAWERREQQRPTEPGSQLHRAVACRGERGAVMEASGEGSHPNRFTTTHPRSSVIPAHPLGDGPAANWAPALQQAPSLGPGALASSCNQHPPALAESTGQMAGLGRGRAGGESRSALKDPASLSLGLGQVSFRVMGGEEWPGQRQLAPALRGSAVTSRSPFVP